MITWPVYGWVIGHLPGVTLQSPADSMNGVFALEMPPSHWQVSCICSSVPRSTDAHQYGLAYSGSSPEFTFDTIAGSRTSFLSSDYMPPLLFVV